MNLVTGSTGIVGIHLMIELLQRNAKVRALCRPSSDKNIVREIFKFYGCESHFDEIEWFEADILDNDYLVRALEGIETIYHTAAMVSFVKRDHKNMWQTNVEGTANLVNLALNKGVKTFCHVSSIGAIGHAIEQKFITENTAWQSNENRSVYSTSKFRQEMEVWRGIEAGLNAVIVNPGVILGPGKKGRSSSLIAQTMQKGTKFYTEGATGYIDARDLARIMVDLVENNCFRERYIVVGNNSTIQEVQNSFSKAFGKRPPYIKAGKTLLHIAAFFLGLFSRHPAITHESVRAMGGFNYYSSEKLIKTLNTTFYPIDESINNMANFIKLHTQS